MIGGGVAGLTLGVLLRRRGVPVQLCEAGHYPRHRVCGEFLSPRDRSLWDELDLEPLFVDAVEARSVRWIWPDGNGTRFELPEAARALSRHRLDARLAAEFEKLGGNLRTGCRVPASTEEGRVWTTGRIAGATPGWIGLKAHYRSVELEADLEMHVGRGAYVGLCRVEEGRVNVCGLFRSPRVEGTRDGLLDRNLRVFGLSTLAERLRTGALDPESVTAVAGLSFDRVGNGTGLRVGDAWAMIPPFTGNGMSMALEGACLAAESLASYARGTLDWSAVESEIRARAKRRFGRRLRHARALHACLFHPWGVEAASVAGRVGLLPWKKLFSGLG